MYFAKLLLEGVLLTDLKIDILRYKDIFNSTSDKIIYQVHLYVTYRIN